MDHALRLPPEEIRPLLRREYDRMVELGWFDEERLELLEGILLNMTPQGSLHAEVVRRLTKWLVTGVGDRGRVQIQSPLAVSDLSEPEPDVAIAPPGDYSEGHPKTAWLVIEVADTSLTKDRDVKASLYAACGIPEYWLVNLVDGVIEIHRNCRDGAYLRVDIAGPDDVLAPEKFPDLRIAVGDILPRTG